MSYSVIFIVSRRADWSVSTRSDVLEIRVSFWNHPVRVADRFQIKALWNFESIMMLHHNFHPIVIPFHFFLNKNFLSILSSKVVSSWLNDQKMSPQSFSVFHSQFLSFLLLGPANSISFSFMIFKCFRFLAGASISVSCSSSKSSISCSSSWIQQW